MRFQCPHCRGIIAVENSDLGADVQCGHCFEAVSVPLSRSSVGAVVGDFIILKELGRGGMGVVFLAHQMSLDRPAAIKVLSTTYANNADFIAGFIKEARAAAKLNHPHIVQAFAVGEDDGIFYFAMEFVDGETMKDVLKEQKIIPVKTALGIIQQIAEALDYAWKEARLIHRDIKPDNIMLTHNGRAKLADLGLARTAGDIEDSDGDEVMGTPQYISPEALTGSAMDVRSDIYSLGATFFHLITGRFAFEGNSPTEIARKHISEPLVPPHKINPNIPENVSLIICKMMAKNIKDRYQDAEVLVEDLRTARKGKMPSNLMGFRNTSSGGNKTLILRNTSSSGSHNITETERTKASYSQTQTQVHRPARKSNKALVISVAIIGIIAFLVIIIVIASSGESSPPRPKDKEIVEVDQNLSYIEAADALIRDVRGSNVSDAEKHRKLKEFIDTHFISNKEEYRKQKDILSLFVPLDEREVTQKSNLRQKMRSEYSQKKSALK